MNLIIQLSDYHGDLTIGPPLRNACSSGQRPDASASNFWLALILYVTEFFNCLSFLHLGIPISESRTGEGSSLDMSRMCDKKSIFHNQTITSIICGIATARCYKTNLYNTSNLFNWSCTNLTCYMLVFDNKRILQQASLFTIWY